MAKGAVASAIFFSVALSSAIPAQADDGCDVLKELVRTSVRTLATEVALDHSSVRAYSPDRSGSVGSTTAGPQSCGSTIEATTKAFSDALASLNMPVSWNRNQVGRDDYCPGDDLHQCYPSQYALLSSMRPSQLAFVHDAWMGVRRAVASQMPFGTASGLSQFTFGSLDAALARSLRTSVEGRLHPVYQGLEVGGGRR